ncbi:hypothetical protein FA15DRAFT_662123 [Coprinopsis marcescibilis]|uniref:Uncharacterized protein n=1 Tax=Coprinopsis marcescibilis TaxID=230819 RepID=A0A5C3K8U4_COPMA|nr:hypothetical protein FA15DRAFT_662123 [Coprinopsis marcescibilis]
MKLSINSVVLSAVLVRGAAVSATDLRLFPSNNCISSTWFQCGGLGHNVGCSASTPSASLIAIGGLLGSNTGWAFSGCTSVPNTIFGRSSCNQPSFATYKVFGLNLRLVQDAKVNPTKCVNVDSFGMLNEGKEVVYKIPAENREGNLAAVGREDASALKGIAVAAKLTAVQG